MKSLKFPVALTVALGLALMLAACAGVPRATPASQPPPLHMQAIALGQQAWYVQGVSGMAQRSNGGFTSNAGFVITDDGIVVFDALATPALARQLLAEIRRISAAPIRLVIVSHYHADHVYGLQVFRDAGAQIWAHRRGEDYLASPAAAERLAQRREELAPWVDAQTVLIAADRWLDFPDGAPITFRVGHTRFELLDGGGAHSHSDLMLAVPEQQLLFAGDLFFSARLPFVVDGNTRRWLEALAMMQARAPRTVVPGHGPASTAVTQDLQSTRRYLEFLRRELGAAVATLEDFDSAYARIDWSAFVDQATFADANRRNAYSVYLELQNEMLTDPSR